MKSYDLSKLTVLIVDRQPAMRALLCQILREFGVGHIVDFNAHCADEGFQEFNHVVPDLVLVDWCPEFDGLALVKRIRTSKESLFPQAPIIMVSAYGETQRVFQALDAGMTEYLVKPVSPSLLYTRIVNAIENARPFIRSKAYTGPCRRRHMLSFAGPERRRSGARANKPMPAAAPAPVATPVAAHEAVGEAAA
ncbi:MAG: response regulator, partial [Rhodospirillales bacterium]|nr:response regulator [Rhodospirillales bacterium]